MKTILALLALLTLAAGVSDSVYGQVADMSGPEFESNRLAISELETLTIEKINSTFPDDRAQLRSILDQIKTSGPLSLERSQLKFLKTEAGNKLAVYFLMAFQLDATRPTDGAIIKSHWLDVLALFDLLNLDRNGIIDVLFMDGEDRKKLLNQASKITVGQPSLAKSYTDKLKEDPLLRDRLMDFLEGEHTRTLATVRVRNQPVKPAPPPPPPLPTRIWKAREGNFTTEAAYIGYSDGIVTLQKQDNSLVTMPIGKLSGNDQAFIRKQIEIDKIDAVKNGTRREPRQ